MRGNPTVALRPGRARVRDGNEDPARRIASLSEAQRASVRAALERRAARRPGIPRRDERGPAPLSYPQQRLWFLDQWEPGAPTHNGARVFRLEGELDVDALRAGLEQVVARHAPLRTVFVTENREPRQVELAEWTLELAVVDLSGLPGAEREAELARRLREEARRPFDLARDVTLRPTLFRLGGTEHVLIVELHHISFDASSDPVMHRELEEVYRARAEGRAPRLPELPIEYTDFAAWQRARLDGATLDELVRHWRAELADAPVVLRLPTDRPRPAVQRHVGAHHELALVGGVADALTELGRSVGATPYMTLLAAFGVELFRFSGQDDVLVGTPIANRNHVELENLIGFFTNTLVIRTQLNGNPSFRELVQRVRARATAAYAHQDLPFDKLVEALDVPRDPGRNPLFQVNFRAHSGAPRTLDLPGVVCTPLTVDLGFSRFDLALELRSTPGRLDGYFEYDEDLFDHATIEQLADDFQSMLPRLVEAPDTPILALGRARLGGAATNRRIPRGSR